MNILTFDIEEWYLEKALHGSRKLRYEMFDRYLAEILDLLDKQEFKATFFVVGKMASEFPEVVKRIMSRGHEIGCHSNVHTWLNKMSRDEAKEDTRQAVDELEQCIGKKILSYRAPAFSIGNGNKWAFEVLAECGIERDSSVYPAARDFGGFPSFQSKVPCIIEHNGTTIKEFPIPMVKLFGKDMAYSGGGYFRFFPLWFVKKKMRKAPYSMCYFHIGDLLPESNGLMTRQDYEDYFKENGSWLNRYKRYVKSNLGKRKAWDKLQKLVSSVDFLSLEDADNQVKWVDCKNVDID